MGVSIVESQEPVEPAGDGPGFASASTAEGQPAILRFWHLVSEDLDVHGGDWTQPGFQAMLTYRLGNLQVKPWIFAVLLRRLHRAAHVFVRNLYGIELYASTRLGRRVKIAHQGSITIHYNAVIGDDCLIRQGVTIGGARKHGIAPTLGRNVEIGAGAAIIGGVKIGDNVTVGPNAVVMMNVPSGATVVAPLSRVIPAVP